jgi:C1A family cysteine protease
MSFRLKSSQSSEVIIGFATHPVLTDLRDASKETEDQFNEVPERKMDSGPVPPKEFDGRQHWGSLVTPISDQGRCGSCWITYLSVHGC